MQEPQLEMTIDSRLSHSPAPPSTVLTIPASPPPPAGSVPLAVVDVHVLCEERVLVCAEDKLAVVFGHLGDGVVQVDAVVVDADELVDLRRKGVVQQKLSQKTKWSPK